MRIFFFGALVALLSLGAGFTAPQANAEEYQQTQAQFASTAELIGRLEAAEAQINRLENSITSTGGGKDGSCGSCGCNDCCDQSGAYAGLEIVALKVFQSEGNYGNNDYQPGARIWAGYQRYDGLGLRIRWFDYNQDIGGEVVDVENFDIELTDAFSAGNWEGLISGGLRYTEMEVAAGLNGDDDQVNFATGLTVGLQLNRYVTDRASIFASLQESLMYGSEITEPMDDIVFSITEIQLGVQVDRCMGNGANAFFRTGIEGQLYAAATDEDSEDLGLFGLFATFGVMR